MAVTRKASGREQGMISIVLEDVVVEFGAGLPGAHRALDSVSLAVAGDECVALVGPTGAGKTTLLEVAAGLMEPDSGRVGVFDGDGASLGGARQAAGLVYQFPELQFFEETVFDDVAFGPRRTGLDEESVAGRVRDALSRSGLRPETFAGRSVAALSAGEKRRAAIAGILALERPFLLLDEPTAGLDPVTREGIIELLRAEAARRGVLLVSHDLELVGAVASRMVVLRGGSVVLDGATGDVLSQVERLESMGLAPPAEYVLLSLVRERAPSELDAVRRAIFDGRLKRHGPDGTFLG